jgi:hypothetical protein
MVKTETIARREMVKYRYLVDLEESFNLPEKKCTKQNVFNIFEKFSDRYKYQREKRVKRSRTAVNGAIEVALELLYEKILEGHEVVLPGGIMRIKIADVSLRAKNNTKYIINVKGQLLAIEIVFRSYYISHLIKRGYRAGMFMLLNVKARERGVKTIHEYAAQNNLIYEKLKPWTLSHTK